MKISGGPPANQTWQTEWKTASLAKVQLCEYENQTLEDFVTVSRSYAKFDCQVARQKRAFSCYVIAAMLEGKNNTFEIRSIFMQNCFIVSALQLHGRRENPHLFTINYCA